MGRCTLYHTQIAYRGEGECPLCKVIEERDKALKIWNTREEMIKINPNQVSLF